MNRYGKPDDIVWLAVDVMAALNAQELPTVLFKDFGKVLARE